MFLQDFTKGSVKENIRYLVRPGGQARADKLPNIGPV